MNHLAQQAKLQDHATIREAYKHLREGRVEAAVQIAKANLDLYRPLSDLFAAFGWYLPHMTVTTA